MCLFLSKIKNRLLNFGEGAAEFGAVQESIRTTFACQFLKIRLHVLRFQTLHLVKQTKSQLSVHPESLCQRKNCLIFSARRNGTLHAKNRQIFLPAERFLTIKGLNFDPLEVFNLLKYQEIEPCS